MDTSLFIRSKQQKCLLEQLKIKDLKIDSLAYFLNTSGANEL